MNRATATEIARRHLDLHVEPNVGQPVAVSSLREFALCWVAGYNTRAFLETRSIRHALAGGGPLIIDKRTGTVTIGTSALPVEDQVEGPEVFDEIERPFEEDE